MCRPGRLDKLPYVDFPMPDERAEIVRTLLKRHHVPLTPDHSAAGTSTSAMDHVAEMITGLRGDGYSGVDLAEVVREACVRALRRMLGMLEKMDARGLRVEKDETAGGAVAPVDNILAALEKVAQSVSKAQRRRYEALRKTF